MASSDISAATTSRGSVTPLCIYNYKKRVGQLTSNIFSFCTINLPFRSLQKMLNQAIDQLMYIIFSINSIKLAYNLTSSKFVPAGGYEHAT